MKSSATNRLVIAVGPRPVAAKLMMPAARTEADSSKSGCDFSKDEVSVSPEFSDPQQRHVNGCNWKVETAGRLARQDTKKKPPRCRVLALPPRFRPETTVGPSESRAAQEALPRSETHEAVAAAVQEPAGVVCNGDRCYLPRRNRSPSAVESAKTTQAAPTPKVPMTEPAGVVCDGDRCHLPRRKMNNSVAEPAKIVQTPATSKTPEKTSQTSQKRERRSGSVQPTAKTTAGDKLGWLQRKLKEFRSPESAKGVSNSNSTSSASSKAASRPPTPGKSGEGQSKDLKKVVINLESVRPFSIKKEQQPKLAPRTRTARHSGVSERTLHGGKASLGSDKQNACFSRKGDDILYLYAI